MPRILIVDDEPANLSTLVEIFKREGYSVETAENGKVALEVMRGAAVDVVLTDLMMPSVSGLDLLKAVKTLDAECEVILMTAYGTVEAAVDAMRDGAYDFITKPFRKLAITKVVKKALERQGLIRENRALKAKLADAGAEGALLGGSLAMRRVVETISQTAPSTATVLVLGETGTGKELVARAIHRASGRAEMPFVVFNCAAVPEALVESEVFGYERGAFTGATHRKEGRFDIANGGTIFFDEVAEMNTAVQAKLLRVLQFGEFDRLGAVAPTRVDVRIVAATNRDLTSLVATGAFREDLFYRLNVITIQLQPLRERREDIPVLAAHFSRRCGERNGKPDIVLTSEAVLRLQSHDWRGNVRELENAVERAVVLSRSGQLGADDFAFVGSADASTGLADDLAGRAITVPLGTSMEAVERRVIEETLRHTRGDKRLAAQILGIAPRTVYRKLPARERASAPTAPDENSETDPPLEADES